MFVIYFPTIYHATVFSNLLVISISEKLNTNFMQCHMFLVLFLGATGQIGPISPLMRFSRSHTHLVGLVTEAATYTTHNKQ